MLVRLLLTGRTRRFSLAGQYSQIGQQRWRVPVRQGLFSGWWKRRLLNPRSGSGCLAVTARQDDDPEGPTLPEQGRGSARGASPGRVFAKTGA